MKEGNCPLCGQPITDADEIKLDREAGIISVLGWSGNKRINKRLKPKITALIEALMDCHGRTAYYNYIFDRLYLLEADMPEDNKILDVYSHQLNKALRETPWWVKSIWGQGYRLIKVREGYIFTYPIPQYYQDILSYIDSYTREYKVSPSNSQVKNNIISSPKRSTEKAIQWLCKKRLLIRKPGMNRGFEIVSNPPLEEIKKAGRR